MNKLERQGSVIILRKAINLLERQFPEVIGNGRGCSECHAHGMGTSAKHDDGCPGLAVIDDVKEIIRVLEAWKP